MNKWIIIILFFCIPQLCEAQKFLVGPKLGGGLSRAFYDQRIRDVNNSKVGLDFFTGGIINFKVSNRLSWHTEILYVKKRRIVRAREEPDFTYIKEWQNYVEVPLLLQGSKQIGMAKYLISFGPRLSYLLGGNGIYSASRLREFGIEEQSYILKFNNPKNDNNYYIINPNRLQLGLDVGLGANFPINQQRLMVNLRYTFGHTHMGDEDTRQLDPPISDPLQYSMHQLTLSAAYLFEFDLIEMRRKGESISDE